MQFQDDEPGVVARFYKGSIQNNFKTQEEGRPIFEERDMIDILIPGNPKLTVVDEVKPYHKERFPRQWAAYQLNNTDNHITGTPLAQWARVTPVMKDQLAAIGFLSVENVAQASDQSIASIGMAVGVSPHTFREQAKNYLKLAADESTLSKESEKVNALQKTIDDLTAKVEILMSSGMVPILPQGVITPATRRQAAVSR
jgi:hypothetical protein